MDLELEELAAKFIAEIKTMEVGSLGHFSSASIHSIHAILSHLKCRSLCNMLLSLSKRLSPASKLFLTATTSMNCALPH